MIHQLPQLSLGESEYKQAKVVFFDDLEVATPEPPSLASNALAWAGDYWNTIAMGGFALVSLVVLRSMVLAAGDPTPTPTISGLQLGDDTDGGSQPVVEDEEVEAPRPKLKLKKAESLKDDLTDMVNTDPDAAAAILSNWISAG